MVLGSIIKQIRLDQGRTIKEIAEEANVTISLLSQIENNKANPSINSLLAIAKVLNVPVGSFFNEHEVESGPVVKSYKRRAIRTQDGVTYYILTPLRKDLLMEFKYTIYEKGGTSGHYHKHEGAECGMVLEGRLEIIQENETYVLEVGDSIYIESTKPHTMKNANDGRTIVIWVDAPPPDDTYM
jgi:transcriptional regulator with XRE-family HTH domain